MLRSWNNSSNIKSAPQAWAEVYAKRRFSPEVRGFASLAGTLELLDSEFLALRKENDSLIEHYRVAYLEEKDRKILFDVARLLGFLEASRPGLSWRQAAANGVPIRAGLDDSCVEALKTVGLGTPLSLSRMFQSSRFRYALRSFAALQGISQADVSHLADVVLAVIVKDAKVVEHHFPEIINDPAIRQFFERRTKPHRP